MTLKEFLETCELNRALKEPTVWTYQYKSKEEDIISVTIVSCQ